MPNLLQQAINSDGADHAVQEGGKVFTHTTGETNTDALVKLISKAAEAGC